MNRIVQKNHTMNRRKTRIRHSVKGSGVRPRLVVHISNMHISAQIINDETHQTLLSATTIGKKLDGTMVDKATIIGKEIAKKAKSQKIVKVVFDRNGKKYHGRMAAVAQAARNEGLEF